MTARRWIAAGAAMAALALPTAAGASSHHHPTVSTVLRDCAHDGRIDGHYSKALLKRAIRALPADIDQYTPCRSRLERVLRHGGDGRAAGHGGRAAVLRDCTSNGLLDKRWPLAKLRDALRHVPRGARNASHCKSSIRDEVRARSHR